MKTHKSKSILRQILVPILCILAIWIAMSIGTTYYVLWVQRSSRQVLVENVSSVRAAEALQITVWRLMTTFPMDARQVPYFRDRWKEANIQILEEFQNLKDSAFLDEEQAPLAKLDDVLSCFLESCARSAGRKSETSEPFSEAINFTAERQHRRIGRGTLSDQPARD